MKSLILIFSKNMCSLDFNDGTTDLLWPSWSRCFCPLGGFCADSRSVPSFRSCYLFWKVQYLTSSTAASPSGLKQYSITSCYRQINRFPTSVGSRLQTSSRVDSDRLDFKIVDLTRLGSTKIT